jgi:RNA polymerase sigma-70 factor (ECF subfamily)
MENPGWQSNDPLTSTGFETDWFVIRQAGQKAPALPWAMEKLCRTYWYPLYAYVRRKGYDTHDAEDLTQAFFTHLLERPWLQDVHQSKGKFRAFLLASINHFLANEWRRAQTRKRGGGIRTFSINAADAEDCYRLEPSHDESPDRIFDHHWALNVLHQAQTRLQHECFITGKADLFEAMKEMLDGDKSPKTYGKLAARLGMTKPAVKKAAQRLCKRYQDLIRAEISETVSSPAEVEEELGHLFAALIS